MDVFEAIEKRHSYRKSYREQPVPREHLRAIVEAGLKAPSGCNAQTTRFIIVDDAGRITEIADILGKPGIGEAKAIIVAVIESREVYHGMSFAVEDASAAIENMLLAITALGYATVWLDGVLRVEERASRIGKLLGVPENRTVRVLLPIGVPLQAISPPPKKPFEERAWFNHWQDTDSAGEDPA